MLDDTLLEIVKLFVLPAVTFAAGFAAQWLLQERKFRGELVHALADKRAAALHDLWGRTALPPEMTSLSGGDTPSAALREQIDRSILEWYTEQAGALFLSWSATHRLFRLLDLIRSDVVHKQDLEHGVSLLRSCLKFDCGIYTRAEARRELVRPRPSPWPVSGTKS